MTGAWSVVGTTSGTSYTDSNDPWTGVHYRVRAVGGSGQSGPSGEYPSLRYAVIDLGTNNFPVAFNNAGSVVLQLGTNTYAYSYPVNGYPQVSAAYTYSYWTNGAVASTIPLATIGGMNNRGDVVGLGTDSMPLYCPSVGQDGGGIYYYDTFYYAPTYKWSAGALSQVGPVPTRHVVPVYTYSPGYLVPVNPLTTTPPGSTAHFNAEIQTAPVGITDGGSTYGTMSESFMGYYIPGNYDGKASYFGILDTGAPPSSVTVGAFPNEVPGIYGSLTAVNANGQAIGGYSTDGNVITTWVAFDGTSYHTLNGIPQYIANNNNIVGTDSTYTNTLLFTNGVATGAPLTNAPCGPINSSNQIVGYGTLWETNIVTKLDDVIPTTNWEFSPALSHSTPLNSSWYFSSPVNGAINDNGAIGGQIAVSTVIVVDADGKELGRSVGYDPGNGSDAVISKLKTSIPASRD